MNILLKVFAREFFNSNSVFFLLLIGFCFGFLGGAEHRALAQYFISTPQLLMIPIFISGMYAAYVMLFNIKTIGLPQNEFIFNFSLLNKKIQWLTASAILSVQLGPIILYNTFLIVMAIKLPLVITALGVSVMLFVVSVTGVFLYSVTRLNSEKKLTSFTRLFNGVFKRHYRFYFIEWMVRKEMMLLSGTKVLSYILLWAILLLYKNESLDARLLNMTLSAVFAGNLALVFHYHRFENYHFMILRNMPFTLLKRLTDFLFTFTLLCLPEFAVLGKNFPHDLLPYDCIQSVLFGLSIGVLLYGMLYRFDMGLEKFIKRIFLICMVWILLILYGAPMWAISLINLVGGSILFKIYYYTFEYVSVTEKKKMITPRL